MEFDVQETEYMGRHLRAVLKEKEKKIQKANDATTFFKYSRRQDINRWYAMGKGLQKYTRVKQNKKRKG